MLAKVPPKRSDDRSSFKDLIEYVSNKDEDEESLNDKHDTSDRRRHNEVLDAIRRNLKESAHNIKAIRRADPVNANAIRAYIRNIGKALEVNRRRYERSGRQFKAESGGVNGYKHQRSLSRTRNNLESAERHISKTGRVDLDFQERARANRANLTFTAGAIGIKSRGDERSSREKVKKTSEELLRDIKSNLKAANHYLKNMEVNSNAALNRFRVVSELSKLYQWRQLKMIRRINKNLADGDRFLSQLKDLDDEFKEKVRARFRSNSLISQAQNFKKREGDSLDSQELESELAFLLDDAEYRREKTPSNISCQHNCLSLETASAEMKAVADQNVRVKDPVYHVVLSWPESESPTDEQAFDCGLHAMKSVGMEGHQYVFAIHRDTDNIHLHMSVNRVNPYTLNAVYPDRDYFKLDKAMRELELKYGWEHDNGPYTVFERNGKKVIDWSSKQPNTKEKQPSKALDMERFTGHESFYTYARGAARKDVVELLKQYKFTWQELHKTLAKHGLEIREKGRGLAVYDAFNKSTVPIKASDLHEQLSKPRLEKRLGAFQAFEGGREEALNQTKDKYDNLRELKRDPVLREERRQERAEARRRLKENYQKYKKEFKYTRLDADLVKSLYAEIRDASRRKREHVRETIYDISIRKQQYSIIAFETLMAREKLKADLREKREILKQDPTNIRLSYRDWVKLQAVLGDDAAISQLRGWAYAEKRKAKSIASIESDNLSNGIRTQAHEDPVAFEISNLDFNVSDTGSVVYMRGKAQIFTDHGKVLAMSSEKEVTHKDIEIALMVAKEKYGNQFEITGTDNFKQKVLEVIDAKKLSVELTNQDLSKLKHQETIHKSKLNKTNKAKLK
ncbi:relaxase/mobilization nuclease domain-containing protein [Zooshikella marina]|uniref:TraI/MobA(P) family conjugative relaxase n=1 Tax=Zooshikella ganghwensis TaxID=202772 RepID=UPI001BAEDAE0|nr:TraI/MobA(P) family conjugative relaxase [Zooshikella ganghwensis]MBU2708699.1 relaxase/mobilization nuclease domain-containing protein [Zooshikella ganghwensis]